MPLERVLFIGLTSDEQKHLERLLPQLDQDTVPSFFPSVDETIEALAVKDVDEVTNTPGKATVGGNVDLPGGKITFGFVVRYSNGELAPSGNLTFKDHGRNISLKATSFTVLNISGNHAVITGYATVNGESDLACILDVNDMGEPGTDDTFTLQIPALNGYSTGGVITGGNIKVSVR